MNTEHKLSYYINNSDKTKYNQNIASVILGQRVADMMNSERIIVHPGEIINDNCSKENAIEFFKGLDDDRILIENMPGYGRAGYKLCTTPEETKEFLEKTGKKFCFDINHAISTAISNKQDYIEVIKEFLKLNPVHFHLGGQKIIREEKSHLCFNESEIDLKKILALLPKGAKISIETSAELGKLMMDLKYLKEVVE